MSPRDNIVQQRDYRRIPKNQRSRTIALQRAVTVGDHVHVMLMHFPAAWLTPEKAEQRAKDILIEMIALSTKEEPREYGWYLCFIVEVCERAFARIGRA